MSVSEGLRRHRSVQPVRWRELGYREDAEEAQRSST